MKLRIDFVDFWKGFDKENNYFINVLKKIYGERNVIVVDKPDFLFFSCFGYKNLKYSCIKIFFAGENLVPDFNLCDYAIGFHEIRFNDRYFRMPLYHIYDDAYRRALRRQTYEDAFYLNRKFCCSIISNSLGSPERSQMVELLNNYKKIDNGGRYRNNIGGRIKNKIDFESKYKFILCFENSSTMGYTTEKLIEGFAGGGIPIYWGNPNVEREYNGKAFINCHHFATLGDAVDFAKGLDQNDSKYLEMVRENIFGNGGEAGKYETIQSGMEEFLRGIFEQEYAKAFRKNDNGQGKLYISRMRHLRILLETCRKIQRIGSFIKNRIICLAGK